MAKKNLPSIELLSQLFEFNYQEGKLYWREKSEYFFIDNKNNSAKAQKEAWNKKFAGKEAGTIKDGYISIIVDNRVIGKKLTMRAHRIIWKLVYGTDPIEIDHINGIRNDNRIENLREVNRSQNNCNSIIRSDNKSGTKGVDFVKKDNCWRARISFNRKNYTIGYFKKIEDAIFARKNAEIKYHGIFVRK